MKNLKDAKTKIYPSKARGGKELPSSSALDSPFVISKLATPPHDINPDMLQVVDDATSVMNDTYDDASTLLDNDDVPLGDFLNEQIARVIQHDVVESDDELETETPETPARTSLPRYKFGLNTLPSKIVVIPYTCGLSRPFFGAVAGEHSYIC